MGFKEDMRDWERMLGMIEKLSFNAGKQAGKKEVVEFVTNEGVMYQYGDTLQRWQAKLKEWGMNV